jgi:hypothetical protein
MLNKFILCVLAALIVSTVPAQEKDVDLRYGSEFDPQGTISSFIGQIGDIIYVSSWKKGFILGGVDANTLKSTFETKIDMPLFNGKEVNFKDIFVLDGQLIMFMQYYDKKADKNYLFAQQVSDRGKLQGSMITLDEIDAENRKNKGSFSVDVYPESGRILLFRNPPFEKYGKEKFAFRVMDKNLETIWEDELELPYADKYFYLSDFFVDKNDDLYVTASFDDFRQTKETEGRKKAKEEAKERGGNYNSYKIITYNYKAKKLKEFELELDAGMKIISVGYNIDTDGNINVTGLYGDVASKGSAIGVYLANIETDTKNRKSQNINEFLKAWRHE